jgi:hypothetical protein
MQINVETSNLIFLLKFKSAALATLTAGTALPPSHISTNRNYYKLHPLNINIIGHTHSTVKRIAGIVYWLNLKKIMLLTNIVGVQFLAWTIFLLGQLPFIY